MLVHNNSKESVLVRGVCHPSVLHTFQNNEGWVEGGLGGCGVFVSVDLDSFSSPFSCILVTGA